MSTADDVRVRDVTPDMRGVDVTACSEFRSETADCSARTVLFRKTSTAGDFPIHWKLHTTKRKDVIGESFRDFSHVFPMPAGSIIYVNRETSSSFIPKVCTFSLMFINLLFYANPLKSQNKV